MTRHPFPQDIERDAPYAPDAPLTVAPVFVWPPQPAALARVTASALIAPTMGLFATLAIVIWYRFSPDLGSARELSLSWILPAWIRNLVLLTAIAGGLHLALYQRRTQGTYTKFVDRWLATDSPKFFHGRQTLDNMFWSLASGVTVWTLYECATWWWLANHPDLVRTWSDDTVYLVALAVGLVFWSQAHFYVVHRILHVGWLYQVAHRLHHRNINTGPWSGIAMHPVEHVLYFSAIVVVWLVPSHPVLVLLLLLYTAVSPAFSHCGFERVVLFGRWSFAAGDYFHHLHHRYFECNYGGRLMPLDALFGTEHDGTAEAHDRMHARRRRERVGALR